VNLTPGTAYDSQNDLIAPSIYSGTGFQNQSPYAPNTPLMLPLSSPDQTYASPLKGILNTETFGAHSSLGATDIFTLHDSNYEKTIGTPGKRPLASAGDTAVCQDTPSGTGLCVRAASSISSYIDSLPDGSSWRTRLTSSQFTYRIPVVAPQFCVNDSCVGNGATLVVGKSDLTEQSSSSSAVTLVSSVPQSGMYNVTYTAKITVAAATSSILGGTSGFVLHYTDGTDGSSQAPTAAGFDEFGGLITVASGNARNDGATLYAGSTQIYAKSGTRISYSFGYASVGTPKMQYAISVRAVLIN